MNTLCHSGPLYPDIRVFFCLFVLRASRLAKFKAFCQCLHVYGCFDLSALFFSVALGGFSHFYDSQEFMRKLVFKFLLSLHARVSKLYSVSDLFCSLRSKSFLGGWCLGYISIRNPERDRRKQKKKKKSQLINQEQTRCCEREELWEFPQTNELRCEETLDERVVIHLQTP